LDDQHFPMPTSNRLPALPADSDDKNNAPPRLADLNAQSPKPATSAWKSGPVRSGLLSKSDKTETGTGLEKFKT
jgi:hypothetical protein